MKLPREKRTGIPISEKYMGEDSDHEEVTADSCEVQQCRRAALGTTAEEGKPLTLRERGSYLSRLTGTEKYN